MEGVTTLRMQHSSLQYSDTSEQQKADIEDLFKHGQQFPIKTGTEAGEENDNHHWLVHFAEKYDHQLHFSRDNFIAVSKYIIEEGTFRRGDVLIADNDETWGHGHDTSLATVSFEYFDEAVGTINVGATHYPVRGAHPGDPNYDINVRSAQKINEWLRNQAGGKALGFVNGDFNMPDNSTDWAFDKNFTSMADELHAWQNTGHGPIDGFCSYDRDRRVSPKWFRVLDDSEFFQFGDHFVCRGAWDIKHLK